MNRPIAPSQEDYQVALDLFRGPLDLLLFLIRRAEVDIQDIPVAAITEQYLELLRSVEDIDVEQAGEFLVMAATLIEIKSRTLMPVETADGETRDTVATDPEDPRYELVQQLLAYQAYRMASDDLNQRRLDFEQRYPLRPCRPEWVTTEDAVEADDEFELELEDVHVFDLSEAYEHIMASIDFTRLGDHLVEVDDTPIELHAEDLLDRLMHEPGRQLTLLGAFGARSRSQRIGMFLAMLELVRMRRVTVVQEDPDDDIAVQLNDDPEVLPELDDAIDALVHESLEPGWHQDDAPPESPESPETDEASGTS